MELTEAREKGAKLCQFSFSLLHPPPSYDRPTNHRAVLPAPVNIPKRIQTLKSLSAKLTDVQGPEDLR
jgi:hypothetical protein